MLLYRGALVYAEDRNHDERSDLTPVEAEVMKHCGELPTDTHKTVTVTPVVNHGRWLIPCPWCFSASAASRHDHRFFCVECRNSAIDGKWLTVKWPASKDVIEGLLVMRPDPRNRNWTPSETVTDLFAENESRGVI